MLYISLLRGINVSGQKLIKMTELKALYESLGLCEVTTYIQSGNVVFTGNKSASQLAAEIRQAIKKKFGFDVHLVVFKAGQFKRIADSNPFIGNSKPDGKLLHVAFLDKAPSVSALNNIEVPGPAGEQLVFKQSVIYLHYPNGMGKSKLSNPVLEKKLGVTSTIRNWNTVQKLLELTGR